MKHGQSHYGSPSPTYRSWSSMRSRCLNPRSTSYRKYGARGVTICPEWNSFEAFFRDMGERPPGHTIDRINPSLGYSPDNCRWADRFTQGRNRAKVILNPEAVKVIRFLKKGRAGKRRHLAALYGISLSTLDGIVRRETWSDVS